MRGLAVFVLLVSCLVAGTPAAGAAGAHGPGPAGPPASVADEILVRFKPGVSGRDIAAAHAWAGGQVVREFRIVDKLQLVRVPPGLDVKQVIERYEQLSDVLYAEPNYIVHALLTPDDPSFLNGGLWGLHNTGQSGGTSDADIDAPEAWELSTGSSAVVVAVIDTGVDYTHPDLAPNMWRNEADCNTNGVDNDGNGYVDDCYGYDFVNNDGNPMDDHFHGTHVSGTIGAVGNNGVGVVGVNWNVKIMACKFLNSGGSGSIAGALGCMDYVKVMKDRGVNVVSTSNSWGGGGFSQALYDAIAVHRQQGILFVAAAGNSNADNDGGAFYPANYFLPNVISVAATTRTDARASFSSYGRHTVHLGAPGQDILSTKLNGTYGTASGTSMATPHVSGVAALLRAYNSGWDWKAVKNRILAGGDLKASMASTITGRRLNAHGAMTCSDKVVLSRLRPVASTLVGAAGTPIALEALHINCASANGDVTVAVDDGGAGQNVVLTDPDGDGIYSGQWTPPATGVYALTFPGNDVVSVQVLEPYNNYAPAAFEYRNIGGTNLNLGDDSSVPVTAPFAVPFGNGSFTQLWVGSNGNVSFTGPFTAYLNQPIPTSGAQTLVAAFWDDLYASGAQNVYWAVTGSAPSRELVIEWRDVRHYVCRTDGTATVKFQIVFFESSSNILFNYADAAFGGGCNAYNSGASASVGVQVSPTEGIAFSTNSATLSGGMALLWTISGPVLDVGPSSLAFGDVELNSSSDRSFTVTNAGSATLTGGASTSSAGFSIVGDGSFDLAGGASKEIAVSFSPTQATAYAGNVSFTSNAGNASRAVTGTGTDSSPPPPPPPPTLTVTAPSGGAVWALGNFELIRWSYDGATGSARLTGNRGGSGNGGGADSAEATSVRIFLSRNGGSSWNGIFSNTANDGEEGWKVKKPATGQARIKICTLPLPGVCGESANFTIR